MGDRKKYLKKDELKNIIKSEVENALRNMVINIEVNPQINVINDTQREVAIGEKGVGAGENTNIGIVGKDGSAAAGTNPESALVGGDGSAQVADPNSAQATTRGNAASQPNDRFNQGTESGKGNLEQNASQ
ncbi:hypothetical protein [Bacillus sp. Marseille-Q1617]|uniref:hypothetical protein n=1 Tax=Bacillus sp. Marseille-Q1617 TaxID=2736887 RepID=UPI00158F4C3E|nr:hypothetical protein [Bacillus sp. Marseille-Q1617]